MKSLMRCCGFEMCIWERLYRAIITFVAQGKLCERGFFGPQLRRKMYIQSVESVARRWSQLGM